MTRTRRIAATVVAVAALAAPTAVALSTAEAEPASTQSGKAQTKQLLKDIAGRDKRLARLATKHSVTDLAEDTETALVSNITQARTALDDLRGTVVAAGSTVDTRAARKELHAFRVQNFRHAVNLLKHVDKLTDDAAADAEAQVFLAQAEDAALEIEATSTKVEVKAAKALLDAARVELESVEPVEPPTV